MQIKNIAIQILKILSYLHQLNPPIIHRDIKPENIILQPDGHFSYQLSVISTSS
ncbi:MAG: hypothetical protein SWX82_22130 [Cyanobacteriota bacterium]|nr:hypothetical protein [Cyanobacteriota bacterium]